MKHKLFFTMLLCLIVCSATGVGITAGVLSNQENNLNIVVSDSEVVDKQWNINLSNLYPGKSEKYTITFNELPANTKISLQFKSKGKSDIGKFVDVCIKYSTATTESKKLSELLNGDKLVFTSDSSKVMEITYSMANTVGNEAQKTSADFVIIINVSNEE